ncbi:MAG: hypothetical protein Q7K26_06180 [bacterium]|nr:hypothetical protein [bacterium]
MTPKTIHEILLDRQRRNKEANTKKSKFWPHAKEILMILNGDPESGLPPGLWSDVLQYLQGRLIDPGTGTLEEVSTAKHRSLLLKFVRTHIKALDEKFGTTDAQKANRVVDLKMPASKKISSLVPESKSTRSSGTGIAVPNILVTENEKSKNSNPTREETLAIINSERDRRKKELGF